MLQIPNTALYLGNSSDLRDIRRFLDSDVTSIIDLAIEEPIPQLPRMINYCRFTITDDGENDPGTLRAAIRATSSLLAGGQTILICCNAGLNRSPSLAAIVLAIENNLEPTETLESISQLKHIDVNPALWHQLISVYENMRERNEI